MWSKIILNPKKDNVENAFLKPEYPFKDLSLFFIYNNCMELLSPGCMDLEAKDINLWTASPIGEYKLTNEITIPLILIFCLIAWIDTIMKFNL